MFNVTATAVLKGWRDPVTFIPRPLLPMEISNSWKCCMVTCYVSNNFWPVVTGVANSGGILPRGVCPIAVSPCGFSSCI